MIGINILKIPVLPTVVVEYEDRLSDSLYHYVTT